MGRHPLLQTKGGRCLCLLAILLIYSYFSDDAKAEPLSPATDSGIWHTVSDSRLDKLRGGFDMGGLLVSFGITRTVYINGVLMAETTLNLGELSQLTPAQVLQLNGQLSGLSLVQNGPGNTVPSELANIGAGTIVQNTLNNQQINVQTLINASSNGLSMIRNMNAQGAINDALVRAATPH